MRRLNRPERTGCEEIKLESTRQPYQPQMLSAEQAEEMFATHGKTFHFAARFFPARYRHEVVTLYAFFRVLDDLVDERTESWCATEIRQELDVWHAWFREGAVRAAPREPLGAALAVLVHDRRVPVAVFHDFLDGLISDLEPRAFQHFHELSQYCYQVAGTVGLAMAHLLGGRSEQALTAAMHLGMAMQLTNILRDVGGDLASGRIYLPSDELERFGSSSAHLRQLYEKQQGPDERFCQLMRYQIGRARCYYLEGLHGVWLLTPECRLPILLAGRLYQHILVEIEHRHYDVLRGRAATNLLTKVREASIVFLLDRLWGRCEMDLSADMEAAYER